MMSLHCGKISKDKHGFIDQLEEIADVSSSSFKVTLTASSLANRFHNQEEGNRAIFALPKFSKTFSIARYSIKLQSFPLTENINLVQPCLLGKIKSYFVV